MGDDMEARDVHRTSAFFINIHLLAWNASRFATAIHGLIRLTASRGLNKAQLSRFDDGLGPGARFELSHRIFDMKVDGVIADVQDDPDRPR